MKKQKKYIKIIIIYFIIILLSLILALQIGKRYNQKVYKISKVEINDISKKIIEYSIDKTIINQINIDKILNIEKDKDNNIKIIDIKQKETTKLLIEINNNIKKYINELENGYSTIYNFKKNIITNENIKLNKRGIFIEMPTGILLDNSLFNNFGPKIPIKLIINGNFSTSVNTKVESYGINVNLLKIYIKVEINLRVIMPMNIKEKNNKFEIPILIRIIQGEIPNYYYKNENNEKK